MTLLEDLRSKLRFSEATKGSPIVTKDVDRVSPHWAVQNSNWYLPKFLSRFRLPSRRRSRYSNNRLAWRPPLHSSYLFEIAWQILFLVCGILFSPPGLPSHDDETIASAPRDLRATNVVLAY